METENGSLMGEGWNSESDENEQVDIAGEAGGEGTGEMSAVKTEKAWDR